jgi:hypothetical protein
MNEKYKEGILLVVGCVAIFGFALYAIYAYTGTVLFILLNGLGIGFQPYSIGLIAVPIMLGLIVIAVWSYAIIFGFKDNKISIPAAVISVPLILSVLTYIIHPYLLGFEAWSRMLLSEILSLFLFIFAPLIGVAVVRRFFEYEDL